MSSSVKTGLSSRKWVHETMPDESAKQHYFDASNVIVSAPATFGKHTALAVGYMVNGKRIPLSFQTPKMSSPFDLAFPYDPQGTSTKQNQRKFSINFYGEHNRPELKEFREVLEGTYEAIVDALYENYDEWFGVRKSKKVSKSREVIASTLGPLIRSGWSERKKEEYPDMLDLKVPVKQRKDNQPLLRCSFFDQNNEMIETADDVHLAGSEVIAIIDLPHIWAINKSQLWPKFVATQVKIYDSSSAAKTVSACNIVDDSPPSTGTKRSRDGDNTPEQPPSKKLAIVEAKVTKVTIGGGDDDDCESDDGIASDTN